MGDIVTLHFQTDPSICVWWGSSRGLRRPRWERRRRRQDGSSWWWAKHFPMPTATRYEGTPGPVELEIAYAGRRLAVTIHDAGKGLPFEPHFPAPPDPYTGNGYGLQVIKELMDEAEL